MTESKSRRRADPVLDGTPWQVLSLSMRRPRYEGRKFAPSIEQRPRAIASDNPKPGSMAPFGAGFWLLHPKFEVSTCQIQP
ncbi:uncharacterized protein G2W53_037393 [Senna tora]|uniref:Uncharacterized protein n=1 Tax=Senna tora TaxID=362788 RepID=A0A834W5M0_9FABA|nr:uncharacterized protein G2W53_037382 [Senna tora]KAF7810650.1 uncharacterized protein G2W53_037393 [Senna tora]